METYVKPIPEDDSHLEDEAEHDADCYCPQCSPFEEDDDSDFEVCDDFFDPY